MHATLSGPHHTPNPAVDPTPAPAGLFPHRGKHDPDTYATTLAPSRRGGAAHRYALAFLTRYTGGTHDLYDRYLGRYLTWCEHQQLDPLAATRIDLEAYAHHLVEAGLAPATVSTALSPVRTLYTLAHADGIIARNPGLLMWRPKIHRDPARLAWLDRLELARWIKVARSVGPRHWATATLTGVLALRASEVAGLQVEDWAETHDGHRVLRFVGKGDKPATMPLTVPILRALDAVTCGRTTGPLIPARDGRQLTRHGITTLVATICRHAQTPRLSPHAIRRSAITAALDAGIPLRDVQALARHADPCQRCQHLGASGRLSERSRRARITLSGPI